MLLSHHAQARARLADLESSGASLSKRIGSPMVEFVFYVLPLTLGSNPVPAVSARLARGSSQAHLTSSWRLVPVQLRLKFSRGSSVSKNNK